MRYGDVDSLITGLATSAEVDPNREVWVVTVHGDIQTPGSLTEVPRIVHVYSYVIDGETGAVTDMCYGCAALPTQ